jgi:hypothetical protein
MADQYIGQPDWVPTRHTFEGVVWVTDPGCGACSDDIDIVRDGEDTYTDLAYYDTLRRLEGKRVRVTIEVLQQGDEHRV